jgi:hypothetical protein
VKQVEGYHQKNAASITDEVIGGEKVALDFPEKLAGEGLEKDGGLDKAEI